MPVPYIIDGTTLCLYGLASYYHSTVHFNPIAIYKKNSMCYTISKLLFYSSMTHVNFLLFICAYTYLHKYIHTYIYAYK